MISGEIGQDREEAASMVAIAETVRQMTDSDDFVVSDSPYVAFLADRMVPPPLVDPSEARISSGALTIDQLIATIDYYDPEVVLVWNGKFDLLPEFRSTVEQDYQVVSDHGSLGKGRSRTLYADPDDDDQDESEALSTP